MLAISLILFIIPRASADVLMGIGFLHFIMKGHVKYWIILCNSHNRGPPTQ